MTEHQCMWKTKGGICSKTFNDAELLYAHLTEEHVGRKVTKNLCLECHWTNCTHKKIFNKRDHIVSHLKTHVALKTFGCHHSFKWLHDFNHHLSKSGHGVPLKTRTKHNPYSLDRKKKTDSLEPPQRLLKRHSDPEIFKTVFQSHQNQMVSPLATGQFFPIQNLSSPSHGISPVSNNLQELHHHSFSPKNLSPYLVVNSLPVTPASPIHNFLEVHSQSQSPNPYLDPPSPCLSSHFATDDDDIFPNEITPTTIMNESLLMPNRHFFNNEMMDPVPTITLHPAPSPEPLMNNMYMYRNPETYAKSVSSMGIPEEPVEPEQYQSAIDSQLLVNEFLKGLPSHFPENPL